MSALTSSPSPAASPRAAFHIQTPRAYVGSPRSAARSYTSNSPKRTFNAHLSSSTPKQPREHLVEIEDTKRAPRAGVADAGTQYSPVGSPPTSRRTLTSTAAQGSKTVESAKPPKEAARSEPSSLQMSTTNTATGSAPSSIQAPNEPQPRIDPVPASDGPRQAASSKRSSGTHEQSEPQEARSTHGHSSAPKRSRPEPGTVKVMPVKYETCNPKDLGILISNMLMELIRLNDQIPLRDGRLTRFHSRAPPGISVSDYLQRLIQHATLSPPILLSMVYYIDRLCAVYTPFTINSLTVHRFLITAATVAAKGLSDTFWTNPTYARIGGIPVSELATLELEFLQKVQWKIVPKPEVLEDYYRSLVDRTQGFQLEGCSGSDSSSLGESDSALKEDDEDEEMADEPT